MAARQRPRRRDQPAHHPRGRRPGHAAVPDTGKDIALELVGSQAVTPSGVTIQVYRPAGRRQYRTATADVKGRFDGVKSFLAGLKECHLRVVIVTNAFFRTEARMRRDSVQLGFGQWIDDVLSSVDTGVRKPNPLMFQRDLDAARSSPHETVMIGDSEEKDILPARQLGMRTIRVEIEGRVANRSEANPVVTRLAEAGALVRRWVAEDRSL